MAHVISHHKQNVSAMKDAIILTVLLVSLRYLIVSISFMLASRFLLFPTVDLGLRLQSSSWYRYRM
jgi:hypothetical protein